MSPTVVVDPGELSLDDQKVIVQHTRDGGYLCLGIGSAAQFLRAVDGDPVLGKKLDERTGVVAVDRSGRDPFLTRLAVAVALAKDYDANEPRDDDGRWTSEGGGAGAAVGSTVAATADALLGNPDLVPALRGLVARLLPFVPAAVGGAVAFFGMLVIPSNRSLISSGAVPDAPNLRYRFDQGTGVLSLTRQREDGTSETLFSSRYDADGVFRDEDGNAIGRNLGSSVVLDADAIRGYEARAKSRDNSQTRAAARADAIADTAEPKVCPDPSTDKSGNKSPGAIAYQMYVGMVVNGEPLPLGLGIRMTRPNGEPVYFDDCRQATGALIEAKGSGYWDQLKKGPNSYPWIGTLDKMLDQAKRQIEAAKGRPIEWHFAEKEVADYIRPIFAKRYPSIAVIYTPPPRKLIGQLKKIIEELRA